MTYENEIKELIEAGDRANRDVWINQEEGLPYIGLKESVHTVVASVDYSPNVRDFIIKAGNSRDAIKALYEENLRLKAENEWRPIETAPKDGVRLMLVDDSDVIMFGRYTKQEDVDGTKNCWVDGSFWDDEKHGSVHEIINPTHWRPLPTPPRENE